MRKRQKRVLKIIESSKDNREKEKEKNDEKTKERGFYSLLPHGSIR